MSASGIKVSSVFTFCFVWLRTKTTKVCIKILPSRLKMLNLIINSIEFEIKIAMDTPSKMLQTAIEIGNARNNMCQETDKQGSTM